MKKSLMRVLLAPLLLATGVLSGKGLSPAAAASTSCSSELDCELSGTCANGVCVCDAGWTGEHCTHLALVPNPPGHYAYHARDPDNASAFWNSWGSSQPVKAADGTYHLIATRVLNGCIFVDYTYNMDLVHAVSDTLLGPYTFSNVALDTVAINPTVVVAPDDETLVLFYSGEPLPAHFHKNCTPQPNPSNPSSGGEGDGVGGRPSLQARRTGGGGGGVDEPPGPVETLP